MPEFHPDNFEERVLSFTAQHWPVRKGKLSTGARLAQDLGMDGDDAVEFFEMFGEEFEVNLDVLHCHWDQHFAPEGSPSFAVIVVLCLCVAAGFWLHDWRGMVPAWAWGIILIAIATVIHYRFSRDSSVPITIEDLVDAARSGRWSKAYLDSVDKSPFHQ